MRGKINGVLLILFAFLLVGCGKVSKVEKTQETPAPTQEPLEEFDWKTQEWKVFEEVVEGDSLSILEYIPLEWEVPEFDYTYMDEHYAHCDGDLYLIQRYNVEGGLRYFLHKLDGDTREISCMELNLEESGLNRGFVSYMQVVSEEEIIFFVIDTEDSRVSDCLVVHMGMDGKLLYETSLYSFYKQNKIVDENKQYILVPKEPFFDAFGNSYYLDINTSQVYMIDKEGKETLICDYSSDRKVNVKNEVPMPDGSMALRVTDYNEWVGKLLWMDGESTTPKTLASVSEEYFENAYVSEYGYVYYITNVTLGGELVRWNLRNGVCESIFSLRDNNISNLQWVMIDTNSKGDVLLYQYEGDKKAAYVLGYGDESEGEKTLTIAALTNDNDALKKSAASYSRDNPGTVVMYEKKPSELEATRTRILTDIANGGGPDMLWVNIEDMRLLQEKGALCDMYELLEPKTVENIFDGIIKSGMVNGEFVGLVTDAYPQTMFTAKSTWAESGWSALEILKLMEERQDLKGLFCDTSGSPQHGMGVLYSTVCYNMTDSPFINFEKGESLFDRNEFVRILELTKEYTENAPKASEESIQNGDFLGMSTIMVSIDIFCEEMRRMGEECHLVGQPSEEKNVGNWHCGEFLVVNRNSPYKEEIAGYLEELLSLENQRQVNMNSIRRDVIEESMLLPEWDTRPQYKISSSTFIPLEAKPDGTPYFKEYLDFLENCGPTPFRIEAISDIIMQEAELFYNGVQDATKTADNIDSRVQLYLDEQK